MLKATQRPGTFSWTYVKRNHPILSVLLWDILMDICQEKLSYPVCPPLGYSHGHMSRETILSCLSSSWTFSWTYVERNHPILSVLLWDILMDIFQEKPSYPVCPPLGYPHGQMSRETILSCLSSSGIFSWTYVKRNHPILSVLLWDILMDKCQEKPSYPVCPPLGYSHGHMSRETILSCLSSSGIFSWTYVKRNHPILSVLLWDILMDICQEKPSYPLCPPLGYSHGHMSRETILSCLSSSGIFSWTYVKRNHPILSVLLWDILMDICQEKPSYPVCPPLGYSHGHMSRETILSCLSSSVTCSWTLCQEKPSVAFFPSWFTWFLPFVRLNQCGKTTWR
ncbi:uncharacterized protein LOC118942958 [Oncorhynchus mykiss]|uniref:uncharacterized protein LOC118942958 n=1 Tax=Oncorhynchus mykiss TaxID=8022 RepID=UPI0018789053|nr:uncharacterized protein LOC118942958 [Oncorhynchus mykiss]